MKNYKTPGKSKRTGISLIELFKMFPDEETARKWFENLLWGEEVKCPRCSSKRITALKEIRSMTYHCNNCNKHFSIKTGTIMQSSKISLQKWIIAIYLITTNLKGISSMKLSRDLKVTQKTAWGLLQKIRAGFSDDDLDKLKGIIECDETYIGGKAENMHMSKKIEAKGIYKKECVFGMKERDGKIIVKHLENAKRDTLIKEIIENVEEESEVYTDYFKSYHYLYSIYKHITVNHSKGEM